MTDALFACHGPFSYTPVVKLLKNHAPEVRRAAVHLLGHVLHSTIQNQTHHSSAYHFSAGAGSNSASGPSLAGLSLALEVLSLSRDGNFLVRAEVVRALSRLILDPNHVGAFFEVVSRVSAAKRQAKQASREAAEAAAQAVANAKVNSRSKQSGPANSAAVAAALEDDDEGLDDVLGDMLTTPAASMRGSLPTGGVSSSAIRKSVSVAASLRLLFSSRHRAFDNAEVYAMIWSVLRQMHKADPFPLVRHLATALVRHVSTEVQFPAQQKRSASRDLTSPASMQLPGVKSGSATGSNSAGGRATSVRAQKGSTCGRGQDTIYCIVQYLQLI